MPENPSRRVCVIWPRFGPYHLARLNGAHRRLRASGAEVVGLEVASRDATYEWRQETRETPWRREVALPGRVYEDVPGPEMEDAVTAALDRIAPDAVAAMTYATPDARAALRWARRQRRTAVMMSETRETDAERSLWREAVKRALVRQYDAALVGGTPHRAYAASLGIPPEAIASPYDVVDNDFFATGADAARREPLGHRTLPGLDHAVPFFLASGRFVARKNLDGLLAAYARYRQRHAADARASGAPWRLLLLGDGPLRTELEAASGDGVVFCGFQQREALPVYYGRAAAFVHPAHMDQWGLVVNEAMAAGLPVLVSTGTGCAPDLVREGENGWTFAPEDTEHLAALLARIASGSDRERLGARSREIIAAYTPEAFGDGLWRAVEAGRARSDRGLGLDGRLALGLLRLAARRVQSFHSIPE